MTHIDNFADEALIRVKAFELWQARGCPLGSPEADWFSAKRSIETTPSAPANEPGAKSSATEQASEIVVPFPTRSKDASLLEQPVSSALPLGLRLVAGSSAVPARSKAAEPVVIAKPAGTKQRGRKRKAR